MPRRDHQLIDPARLRELEQQAQEGKDFRAALNSLGSKRLDRMQAIREGEQNRGVKGVSEVIAFSRGWLEFESDLGDALVKIQRQREGQPVAEPVGEGLPF